MDFGGHYVLQSALLAPVDEFMTYRLRRCINSILVVFSMDLTSTLVLGVMGELASFRGLKFITALRMRPEVAGLVRTRIDMQFRVPSTTRASLQ